MKRRSLGGGTWVEVLWEGLRVYVIKIHSLHKVVKYVLLNFLCHGSATAAQASVPSLSVLDCYGHCFRIEDNSPAPLTMDGLAFSFCFDPCYSIRLEWGPYQSLHTLTWGE